MTQPIEPSTSLKDARAACAVVYETRAEAVAVARRLRAAGWIVPIFDTPEPTRGGASVVAVVHPPGFDGDSPGDVRFAEPEGETVAQRWA